MARTILLARHGAAEGSPGGFLGRTDLPLGDKGHRQAAALGALVREHEPKRCLASPLRRAAETARIVAAPLHLTVETDPDLIEVDFGAWEGRRFAEIQAAEPELAARWANWDANFAFPGGESLAGFLARIERATSRLVAAPEDTVLAVAHGGVVRAALCQLLGLPSRSYLAFDIRHCGLAVIAMDEGKGALVALDNRVSQEA